MTSRRKDIRIKRTTADILLEGLKNRIIEINTSDNFNYKVERAVVFGSYVNTDCEMVGDLDVAVSLKPKWNNDEQKNKDRVKSEECKNNDFLICLFWPQMEVKRYLKNRSAYISIHDLELDKKAVFSKNILELQV